MSLLPLPKKVYSEYCDDSRAPFGVELCLDLGRELNDIDNKAIFQKVDELKELLLRNSVANNKELQQQWILERQDLLNIFPRPIFVEEIPYGYCSKWCCSHRHWLLVTTEIGIIEIGLRKRVINIDWSRTKINEYFKAKYPYAYNTSNIPIENRLFPEHQGTKSTTYIHASDLEYAKKIIDRLLTYKEL